MESSLQILHEAIIPNASSKTSTICARSKLFVQGLRPVN